MSNYCGYSLFVRGTNDRLNDFRKAFLVKLWWKRQNGKLIRCFYKLHKKLKNEQLLIETEREIYIHGVILCNN